jgi:hypothetical protein
VLKHHACRLDGDALTEIPMTTLPLFKTPIHVSYLLYLGLYSRLALLYWRTAPSLLLHPLDFLGCHDTQELSFFPAMGVPAERKLRLVGEVLDLLRRRYEVVPMRRHAEAAAAGPLRQREPALPAVSAEAIVPSPAQA